MPTDKSSRRAVLAAVCAALLIAAPAARAEDSWPDLSKSAGTIGGGERDAAVIVGAENYAFVERVPGAKQNADDWQSYLTETLKVPADRVALLLDDDATLEEIRQAAAEKAAQVEPDGALWFVFIGHGAPSKDGEDGLLVGVDAQQKASSVYSRSFSRNELLRMLAQGKQSKTVVLIDACFSGKSPSGHALVAGLQPLLTMRALPAGIDGRTVLMTAARSDQFAGPLPGGSRPAFSYLALGALRGWAADSKGQITASDLVTYVRRALSLSRDRTQTPELSTPETAAVVLGMGREAGPDLAKLQREAASSSGRGFQVANLEAVPAAKAPKNDETAAAPARATTGNAGIVWVPIAGGTFTMGSGNWSAKPSHTVAIKDFQMAKTLVTNKQYKACVDAGACKAATPFGTPFDSDDRPVVGVDWNQAKAFSQWAGGRLPTEAEWEYAARSEGKDQEHPWGKEEPTCALTANFDCSDGGATAPVCSKTEGNTRQGLCDMLGDAAEWVEDSYHDSYDGAPTDGSAWEDAGGYAVHRGGSWHTSARGLSSTYREFDSRSIGLNTLGFRPAR